MARRARKASKPKREPKVKSKKTKPAASADVVEGGGGSGIDDGVAVVTAIVLLVAILFVDAHLGHYGAGFFFK